MLIGRYLGTFIGVILASIIPIHNIWDATVLWIIFAAIGTGAGMVISILLGINVNTDRPIAQDSLKYWTDIYGEELGREAYKMWLDEL
jgi:hypothetical protein